MTAEFQPEGAPAAPAGLVVGAGEGRIWGMTAAERLRRIFARLKLVHAAGVEDAAAHRGAGVVMVRGDWVVDESVVRALVERPGAVLFEAGPSGLPMAAHVPAAQARAVAEALAGDQDPTAAAPKLARVDTEALGLAYNVALRKREPPVLERLSAANVRSVEARLFKGSYKGVTDLVTKYVWPRPARIVTRWCALAGLTPNQVTLAGLLLVIAAFALFWTGQFGWGLACAWLMTFLDTVDGKLARVTLTSSKFGNIFDHGIDLVHPPFWWWAWWVGVQAGPHPMPWAWTILAVLVGGYWLQRLTEAVFIGLFKLQMHAWRPFDSFFRLITARRNPNLILLTVAALAGRPDLGLIAVAAWTAISLLVHVAQILQGLAAPGRRVVSWMEG